jgi:hypothetical protein
VDGVAVDPTDPSTIYLATAGGGVWKTTDGGQHWGNITDNIPSIPFSEKPFATQSITIDPTNHLTVYVGTGDFDGGDGPAQGLLKSTDGGVTWSLLGHNQIGGAITAIVVDPTTPATIYVASSGGVWKNTNGGADGAWTSLSLSGPITGLVMNPDDSQNLYASIGASFPNLSNGVYRTTDGGASWVKLLDKRLPADGSTLGRIAIAISKTDSPVTLYVNIAGSEDDKTTGEMFGHEWAFLKSSNIGFGDTFQDLTASLTQANPPLDPFKETGQGWYDNTLAVDPTNANVVFIGGQAHYLESRTGGASWSEIQQGAVNGPHSDHHAVTFDPNGKLVEGNDGGVWRLEDPTPTGPVWKNLNGAGLQITQFVGIALDPTTPNIAWGGSQDNGTEEFNDGVQWNQVLGGDGGFVQVNPIRPTTVFHEFQQADAKDGEAGNGFLERSDNGGLTWTSKTGGINGTDKSRFYIPYAIDPGQPSRLLLGTDRVYESLDNGDSWHVARKIGDTQAPAPEFNGDTVAFVAAAPTDPDVIYASAGARIWVTRDHGSDWTIASPTFSSFPDIFVDPLSSSTLYTVVGDFTGVFKSTDFGATWTDITGDLPRAGSPTLSILKDPISNDLYVGTDHGVWVSSNGGQHWVQMGTNFPVVPVRTLDFSAKTGILAAGTFGRGMWEIIPNHFQLTPSVTPVPAGGPFDLTATLVDYFGNPVVGVSAPYVGMVHVTSSDPKAVLPADYQFTSGDHGSHTFTNLVLATTPSQSITINDVLNPDVNGTVTVQIVQPPATHFVLSAPASPTAGSSFDLTVTAEDQFNNTVLNYTGTVHFSSTDGQGVVPGDYTFVAGDSGVHTFSQGVTLKTSGTQFVFAQDTGAASVNGQASIQVQAAQATQFVLAAPASVQTNQAFSITLTVEDGFGNAAASFRGLVHFTSNDTHGTLPGDYTFTNSDQGVHTFSGVVFRSGGNRTVTATDSADGLAASASVQVIQLPPTHFGVAAPASANAGSLIQVTVVPLDAGNNVIYAYTGTVHFTSTDGQALLPADYTFTAADQGVHTFTNQIALRTAGTQGLTVTDTGNSSIKGSANVNIAPIAANHFGVLLPTSSQAGQAFTMTVTALDPFNNTDPNFQGGTAVFTSSDRTATLPAPYTFQSSDRGSHTFISMVTLDRAGSDTITASLNFSGSSFNGSGSMLVRAAAATHMQLGAPPSAAVQIPITVTVSLMDQFNNVATGYTGTVHFTASGTSVLPPDYTFTAADLGVHTFVNGVTLNQVGTQALTVVDTVARGITASSMISVSPGAAAQLRVIAPASVGRGTSFNVTVTVMDGLGNVATGFTGTVHFTSSDPNAVLPADYTFTPGDGGVHTFAHAFILRALGNQTIVASAGGSVTGSASVTVNSVGTPFVVTGADAGGGPEVKLFDRRTGTIKLDFYAYAPAFTGGVRVALADVNGDGTPDVITAPGPGGGPDIRIFDGVTGQKIGEFNAYSAFFSGGVFLAAGDMNGDGRAEIVTAPDAGGGPDVRVFDPASGQTVQEFMAYAPAFTGGVRVAVGDINGDGVGDIITAPGAGGGPEVKAFSGLNASVFRDFMAYDPNFTGGVYVAAGDTNGDGKADIVTGAGGGGGPHVKVFSGADNSVLQSFFAYDASFAGGVRLGVLDLNGDGKADIVTGGGAGAAVPVKVFDGTNHALLDSFFAYDQRFLGGVFVGGR